MMVLRKQIFNYKDGIETFKNDLESIFDFDNDYVGVNGTDFITSYAKQKGYNCDFDCDFDNRFDKSTFANLTNIQKTSAIIDFVKNFMDKNCYWYAEHEIDVVELGDDKYFVVLAVNG